MRKRLICLMAFVAMLCSASAQQQRTIDASVFTVAYATSDDGFLNVRSKPSNSGKVLTKLWMQFHGLGNGVLREQGEKWSKVSVGNITGWVYNKYLGTQSWYSGEGNTILVAGYEGMPIFGENYADEGDYPVFTTVRKGTILADEYDMTDEYFVLKTGHDYLFIKKGDVEVKAKGDL